MGTLQQRGIAQRCQLVSRIEVLGIATCHGAGVSNLFECPEGGEVPKKLPFINTRGYFLKQPLRGGP